MYECMNVQRIVVVHVQCNGDAGKRWYMLLAAQKRAILRLFPVAEAGCCCIISTAKSPTKLYYFWDDSHTQN